MDEDHLEGEAAGQLAPGGEEGVGEGHEHGHEEGRPVFNDEHTAFVKGMGHELEESDLRELFADVAGLKEVRLARDQLTHVPRVRGGRELVADVMGLKEVRVARDQLTHVPRARGARDMGGFGGGGL